MKKIVIGGTLLGAGLCPAALVGLSGVASAGSPSPSPKVTVDCSAEAVPPAPPAGARVEEFKAASGEGGRAEHGTVTRGPDAGPPPQDAAHTTVEVKDGRLYIDGKERPLPKDCGEDGPATISVSEEGDS